MAKQFKKALELGVWITATIFIVNFVLEYLSISVQELFGVSGTTGITTSLGNKVISVLQSLISFDLMSVITLYISAVLIVFVGTWLRDNIKMLPNGKSSVVSLTLALLYGTAVFYLILVGTGMPAIGTLIGLVVYYGVIALSLNMFKGIARRFA